jgi:hypothetical protein
MNLPGIALQQSADAFMNLSNNTLTLSLVGAVFRLCAAALDCLVHLGSAWHQLEVVERCLSLHNGALRPPMLP